MTSLNLLTTGALSVHQHGFMKGRSCITNLLSVFEISTKWIDDGYGIDIIDLDYKKAFDSVSHVKLIQKMHAMNVDSLNRLQYFCITDR